MKTVKSDDSRRMNETSVKHIESRRTGIISDRFSANGLTSRLYFWFRFPKKS